MVDERGKLAETWDMRMHEIELQICISSKEVKIMIQRLGCTQNASLWSHKPRHRTKICSTVTQYSSLAAVFDSSSVVYHVAMALNIQSLPCMSLHCVLPFLLRFLVRQNCLVDSALELAFRPTTSNASQPPLSATSVHQSSNNNR